MSTIEPPTAVPAVIADDTGSVVTHRPNWALAGLAGLAVAAVMAVLYAVVSAAMDREILYAMLLVGGLSGLAVNLVVGPSTESQRRASALTSAVTGAAGVAAAIILYLAAEVFGDIGSAFANLGNIYYDRLFEAYFSDPLGYVWSAAGVIAAAWMGYRGRTSRTATLI